MSTLFRVRRMPELAKTGKICSKISYCELNFRWKLSVLSRHPEDASIEYGSIGSEAPLGGFTPMRSFFAMLPKAIMRVLAPLKVSSGRITAYRWGNNSSPRSLYSVGKVSRRNHAQTIVWQGSSLIVALLRPLAFRSCHIDQLIWDYEIQE